ncbi:sugar ABC transporter ATP-binding protein [Biomaibacter acetigenes]|uniref:Sugar ABC transporter ATP-binding protein n=1 Tax=Biomaibacter acetigenes TaxID=2316383 RepID=A0A3G2R9Y7_9FIRM|nr:sugar ABC transporter ATP-binding protein [Biomaibacter acetigenes]AYO31838.1 sugar ABC transporter ATP-binding protein [Biomaibacter acetigenes]
MAEIILKATNISKAFAGVQALKNVNLTIHKGEIHCLAGENGSGKSTLIKIISGVYEPDEGLIEIGGKVYSRLTPMEAIDRGIQIIYQDLSIFPNLTVAENIALNLELSGKRKLIDWKRVKQIAKEAIDKIGFKINLDEKVENLSVAEKQLIAISRALLNNAKIIIMDEPTTALTKKEVAALFNIIKNLQSQGISILFVSHKLDEVFEISEKITILRNGQNVISGEAANFDNDLFVYYMTGRKFKETHFEAESRKGTPLLKVENLSLKNGFKDISFELYAGEILGITGLLGSGRTELALSLFGLLPADSGKIYIDGNIVKINSVQDAIKNKMGYVPEDRLTEGLFMPQSIGRNIIISNIKELLNKNGFMNENKIQKCIDEWIKKLGIVTPSQNLPVQTLSGGNQQRVVLAKWLSMHPRILILNGPTVGVDIGSKYDIHQILRNLAAQGIGIIIISDDIPEVLFNCNRILIMRKGRIINEVMGKDVTEEELAYQMAAEA